MKLARDKHSSLFARRVIVEEACSFLFVPWKPLQACLTFPEMSVYLSIKHLASLRNLLGTKTLAYLPAGSLTKRPNSRLLWKVVTYGRKKFYEIVTWRMRPHSVILLRHPPKLSASIVFLNLYRFQFLFFILNLNQHLFSKTLSFFRFKSVQYVFSLITKPSYPPFVFN